MSLSVQRSTEDRESLYDGVVEAIVNTPRILIDPLSPAMEVMEGAENSRKVPLGSGVVEPIHALGPDNINWRAGWPARHAFSPVPRWPKHE